MNDCGIEPGDIVFVVSNSNKLMAKFKRFAQSFTTSRRKHGHMEVISVFVCTGKNKYGVICHNFEKQLTTSSHSFVEKLAAKSIEELSLYLLNYCTKEFDIDQIKKALENGAEWMRLMGEEMQDVLNRDELVEGFLAAVQDNKEKIIQLMIVFWHASKLSDILPAVNSSLLLFKHNDMVTRQKFLDAYLAELNVTERLHAEGKQRTSSWAAVKSFCFGSSQDSHDREKYKIAEGTICSSHLMQVLNQVDPDLVNRGRNVSPKSLEAGFREATKYKTHGVEDESGDDFEKLISSQEKTLPPFKMVILPSSGTDLMIHLLSVIDQEIHRIEHKFLANASDKQKAADLKKLLLHYRNPKFQSYPVNLQVDVSLEIIATLLPVLQKKTGIFGAWIRATSYAHVRSFARSQGIFDGDIREATEKLKKNVDKNNGLVNESKQESAELGVINECFAIQPNIKQKTYQSGIDTKAFFSQSQYRKPIFKPVDFFTLTPSVKYYRNEVYNDLIINHDVTSPFQYFELLGMNATENLVDSSYDFHSQDMTSELINKRKAESKQTLFQGSKNFLLDERWQALPSLNPEEKILDVAIKGLQRTDFEIKYSAENHLYYIRLTQSEPKNVSVNLLLRMPEHYRANPIFNTIAQSTLQPEIHRLLMKYLKFGKDDGTLRSSTAFHNADEYLNEARRLEIASCRLRAIAFKEEMKRLYPEIAVTIIVNSSHCFVEMKCEGRWYNYCLGGYRDVPNFVENMKENTLESLGCESKRDRFFREISQIETKPMVNGGHAASCFAHQSN